MATEIERKFLVKPEFWLPTVTPVTIRQGYLKASGNSVVRVRTMDDQAFLTIKGKTQGISRLEFEYSIPAGEANQMLDTLAEGPLIEKQRYSIRIGENVWEVDEFFGENAGLLVAEIELESEQAAFSKPNWVGEEVSQDARYFNSNLATHPYKSWACRATGA